MITVDIRFECDDNVADSIAKVLNLTIPYIIHDMEMFDLKDVRLGEHHVFMESLNDLHDDAARMELEILINNTLPFMADNVTITFGS